MKFARQFLASVLLAAGAAAAWAAPAVPAPLEFYFDADPAAVPMIVVEDGGGDLVSQLARHRERGRRGVEATVQLAGVAFRQGRAELGHSLYAEALEASPASSLSGRSVRWNHAWDLYRLGEVEAAMDEWLAAASNTRSHPSWVPPTFALALWKMGRRDEAVAWYAAAVRTEPTLWRDASQHARLLPTWQDEERKMLAEVQQAWATAPPAWP